MYIKIKRTIHQISLSTNKKEKRISLDQIKGLNLQDLHFEKGQCLFDKTTKQLETIIDIRESKTLGNNGSSFLITRRKRTEKGIDCTQWMSLGDIRDKFYLISMFEIGDIIITSQLKLGKISQTMRFDRGKWMDYERDTYSIHYFQAYTDKNNLEFLKDYLSNEHFKIFKYGNTLDYFWQNARNIFLLDWENRLIDISKKGCSNENGFSIIQRSEWIKYTKDRLMEKINYDVESRIMRYITAYDTVIYNFEGNNRITTTQANLRRGIKGDWDTQKDAIKKVKAFGDGTVYSTMDYKNVLRFEILEKVFDDSDKGSHWEIREDLKKK